jgi:hypothetical protein
MVSAASAYIETRLNCSKIRRFQAKPSSWIGVAFWRRTIPVSHERYNLLVNLDLLLVVEVWS